MIKQIYLSVFTIALLVALCVSCSESTNVFTDNSGNEFTTNKIYKSVSGLQDSTLDYSIYIPKSVGGKVLLPVLFLLDPHANGNLPVEKYAELADKYNYILVGSNISQNGLETDVLRRHVSSLINEVKSRFKVDNKRLFIGGFSGGAKLAVLFADRMPELIGAIACGGSMPASSSKQPQFYYAGIVGNKDFNYLEIRQSYALYDQYGYDYTAEVFDGKHEWPPVESFEMGIIGFEMYSAKIKRKELSKDWIDEQKQSLLARAETFKQEKKSLYQYEVLQQANRWFYGISSVSEIQKEIGQLTQSRTFNLQLKKRQQLFQQEVKLRMEFIKALDTRDFAWWKSEVDKIKSSDIKPSEANLVRQRLLNYISMASYMFIKNDLNDGKFDNASDKIKIYELVDPTNPDVYLMYAKYYLLNSNTEQMEKAIDKAKQLGFKPENYSNDEFWRELLLALK